jgi:NADH:ubiquinone oxidoreductase subunit F (NADH-binding)
MLSKNVLNLIKKAKLRGRGGADFPVDLKWQSVKNQAEKSGQSVAIVINCSEGEPGVFKDAHVLENYLPEFFLGLRHAVEFFSKEKVFGIYFFTSTDYAKEFLPKIEKELNKNENSALQKRWHNHLKSGHSYISGEESALLNVIEFSLAEPRLKPPYPSEKGLFGLPTLVNNLETFYNVGLVVSGKFKKERFYSITGAVKNPGVYPGLEDANIEDILKSTNNFPFTDFFVIVGGDMSGEVLNQKQLKRPVGGAGSIRVYPAKINPRQVVREWLDFYVAETCGHCTPCREGTFRLLELFKKDPDDFLKFKGEVRNLIDNLSVSSFCALGASLPTPLNSYAKNILKIKNSKNS